MNKIRVTLTFALLLLQIPVQAETYRACINGKVKTQIQSTPCDIRSDQTASILAQSKCGPLLLDELLNDPNLAPGSPEFTSTLQNKKIAALSDVRELIASEGKRCGLDVQLSDDGGSSTSSTQSTFSFTRSSR